MWRTVAGPDRHRLGFAASVQSAFGFLVSKYGLRCLRAESTFVRYQSERVFVNIYHGRASYELGFEVGQLPEYPCQPERPFRLGEIIQLAGAEQETGYTFLQASSEERVRRLVPELADLVQRYAGPALDGDPETFQQLAEVRSERSRQLVREAELGRIRHRAEEAWRAKRYALVAALYESIPNDLTRVERAKLAYAKRHSHA